VRITGITTHVVGTPWRNLTFVQVHTDEGLTGVGETRMLGHTDALLG
jgi:galactonate dehydratase